MVKEEMVKEAMEKEEINKLKDGISLKLNLKKEYKVYNKTKM